MKKIAEFPVHNSYQLNLTKEQMEMLFVCLQAVQLTGNCQQLIPKINLINEILDLINKTMNPEPQVVSTNRISDNNK